MPTRRRPRCAPSASTWPSHWPRGTAANGVEDEGEFLKAEKVIPAPEAGEGHARRLEVHLHHGKKREVRRLFEANRYFVKKLVRVQIGQMVLKGMPKGGIKILARKDIERLFLNSR